MIDLTGLVAQIVAALGPAVPMLLGKVADGVAQEAQQDAVDLAKTLWARLRPSIDARPAAHEAVEDVAEDPSNEDARAALRQQLRKLLAENPDLQRELARTLSEADSRGLPSLYVEASGPRSVALGGNNLGSIGTGDNPPSRSGRG